MRLTECLLWAYVVVPIVLGLAVAFSKPSKTKCDVCGQAFGRHDDPFGGSIYIDHCSMFGLHDEEIDNG